MEFQNRSKVPYRRSNGEVVQPGAAFEATEREEARIARRGYLKSRLFEVGSPVVEPGKPGKLAKWPLKMAPDRYLDLHPDGEHADLAKAHAEAEAKKDEE